MQGEGSALYEKGTVLGSPLWLLRHRFQLSTGCPSAQVHSYVRHSTFKILPVSLSTQVPVCYQLQKRRWGQSIYKDCQGKCLRKCFTPLKHPPLLWDDQNGQNTQREKNWCEGLGLPSLPYLGNEMRGWRNPISNPGVSKLLDCRPNLVTACFHK